MKAERQKDRLRDEDLPLVERCRRGESEAFELLVRKYYERMVTTAYSVVRRQEDALDVVQNAFLKAYQGIAKFSGRSSFSTWLYRIVVNQAIDWKRRAVRREAVSLNADTEGKEPQVDQRVLPQPVEDPRQAAFGSEVEAHLERCLESLSPEHQQAILLREIQGLSYQEIAEIMGCRVGTVMSRLHYAREALRARLGEWL